MYTIKVKKNVFIHLFTVYNFLTEICSDYYDNEVTFSICAKQTNVLVN